MPGGVVKNAGFPNRKRRKTARVVILQFMAHKIIHWALEPSYTKALMLRKGAFELQMPNFAPMVAGVRTTASFVRIDRVE